MKNLKWRLLSISGLMEVAAVFLCAVSLTGFLSNWWWMFELTSHFRLHLAMALGLTGVICLFRQQCRIAAVCGLFVIVNAALVCSLFWPAVKTKSPTGAKLRLVGLNVMTSNQQAELVLKFLLKTDADVILLMEVNARWLNDLSSLKNKYPYQLAEAREDNSGIALFSRIALTNGGLIKFGETEIPSVKLELELAGQKIFLLGTHTLPPVNSANARLRNQQLENIASVVRNQKCPAIVIGDFNCTPWSPYYSRLLAAGGLKNTSQGFGVFSSWPAWWHWAGIPIDHCLVTSSFEVLNKQLGSEVGSDHLPVITDLQLGGH